MSIDLTSQERGQWGEDLAAQALDNYGYEIIDRNWHSQWGEIDLVAKDGLTWVFVEVRLRGSRAYETPAQSIRLTKRSRLWKTVLDYLFRQQLEDVDWRIDIVAITTSPQGKVARLDHYRNAIQSNG